jgi:hypothetical protein
VFQANEVNMARISIVHATEYTYRNPVGLLRHKLMLRPDESHDLRLHRSILEVEPEPLNIYWKHDVFNNSICFLEWPEASEPSGSRYCRRSI